MADTEPATIIPSTWNSAESLRLDGDAVEKLASLGALATGVEITTIVPPADIPGLPAAFPVAVLHGEKPSLASVKALAEEWREFPSHRRGIAVVGDVESFCALVNRQKTDDTVVFAVSDWRKPSLTAVLDYHAIDPEGEPAFGRHRVHYAFPFSDQWKTWLTHDGTPMDQAEFAEFVEERLVDMTTLVAAENAHHARELQVAAIGAPIQIAELARGLEINIGGKVKQNLKLQSGEAKLSFEEEHTGKDGAPLIVPGAFALSIPLFYNEEPITIPVRLRYRLVGGSVVWIYKLFRVDRIVAEAVDRAKKDVVNETSLDVFEGMPEMNAGGDPVRI